MREMQCMQPTTQRLLWNKLLALKKKNPDIFAHPNVRAQRFANSTLVHSLVGTTAYPGVISKIQESNVSVTPQPYCPNAHIRCVLIHAFYRY